MRKEVVRGISLLTLSVGFGLVSQGCARAERPTPSPPSVASPTASEALPRVVKGFGISPQGFPLDYSKFADFLGEVGGMTNGAVMWNGAWRGDVVEGTDAGSIPTAAASVMKSAHSYDFTPIVVFGWRTGATLYVEVPANPTNDWTNAEAKGLFREMLMEFASTYQPPYMFLGNESDAYYEQNPADYANWIAFYNGAYDAIKAVSPGTLVGPVFNYEHLAGSGTLNGWTTAYWEALDSHDFTRVDIVGVTVYPWLNYATADAVPASYLDPLMARIGSVPIAVTETGWPAENLGGLNPPGETSEAAQVTYLARLSSMLEGKDVRVVNWLHLYPMLDPGGSPVAWKLFGSVSIRDRSGNARAVYEPWL